MNNFYGLVACGGGSRRMGLDKGSIIYFEKQHRYHLYEMLAGICEKVFLSCSKSQSGNITGEYEAIIDLPEYKNIGPMAALLTAFKKYPYNNFLTVGCDYPFISENVLRNFISTISGKKEAAAFFNVKANLYEPLIGWYSFNSATALKELFNERNYSLQYYLKTIDAEKYIPDEDRLIKSADTPQEAERVKVILNNQVKTENEK